MERGLSLLIAAVMLFVAPSVQAADDFSFTNAAVNITNTGCGKTKLCIQTPDNCDPAGNSSCFFASVAAGNTTAPNGTELMFQLSGNSTGYIALGLTANATQGTTALYICAQNSSNNPSFVFAARQRNNTDNTLSTFNATVTKIRGQVVNGTIQCEFSVPNLNATNTRSADSTTYVVILGSGPLNGNDFGTFTTNKITGSLNLANPSANVANPTASPTTTKNSASAADSFSFATNATVNITNTGCGKTKLCIQTPDNCDPAATSSCFFASVAAGNTTAPNGTELMFQLSGNSTGYIALGLTANATQGTTALYICAQNSSNNASFVFAARQRNNINNTLSTFNATVTKIRGQVVNGTIQCEFSVPNLNATNTRSTDSTTYVVILGSGPLNGNDFGTFTASKTTDPLNLANPSANVATKNSANGALHSHALTVLLTVLTLFVLKTA
ncbi:putative ferric-chelate reductase 1 [Oreochromis niloticus]|uniref:putative ferric-chelate reductase 1 n=1 Tax=Oreochromis niloticus TaxID=8128 RepID=UPI000905CA9F|nr:putative ferric-chelate reductase 1 [Oreochromis niloticus]